MDLELNFPANILSLSSWLFGVNNFFPDIFETFNELPVKLKSNFIPAYRFYRSIIELLLINSLLFFIKVIFLLALKQPVFNISFWIICFEVMESFSLWIKVPSFDSKAYDFFFYFSKDSIILLWFLTPFFSILLGWPENVNDWLFYRWGCCWYLN